MAKAEFKIDAAHKILGRIASEAAFLLRGKNAPDFEPSRVSENKVVIFNTDKMRVTGKKLTDKIYYQHSGYHGGLKEERLIDLMKRDSRLPLRYAVMGMLPKNKLRSRMIKNLALFRNEDRSSK